MGLVSGPVSWTPGLTHTHERTDNRTAVFLDIGCQHRLCKVLDGNDDVVLILRFQVSLRIPLLASGHSHSELHQPSRPRGIRYLPVQHLPSVAHGP